MTKIDENSFINITSKLINLSSSAWSNGNGWATLCGSEPVWYENIRVFQWIKAIDESISELVVEKFTQKLGAYLPPHSHPKSSVRLYLLSGSISLIMDNKITVLKPGEDAFIPAGREHAVFASDDSECVSIHYEKGGLSIEEPFDSGKVIEEVFGSIRSRFTTPSHDSNKEFDILSKIKNYPGFIYGVLVAFNEDDNALIFKSHLNPPNENISLPDRNKFLSAVIHHSKDQWSPNTVYIFCDDPSKIKSRCEKDWYQILPFDVLPEETRAHIFNHFTHDAINKVCVYCPFIIPDNRALANFVGFYKDINPVGIGNPFLEHISAIQHAGTLIFARLAISKALSSKEEKIKRPLNTLRKLRQELDKASAAIGEIEAIINPYYLHLSKQEIEALVISWSPFFETEFHDVRGKVNSWEIANVETRSIQLKKIKQEFNARSWEIKSVLDKASSSIYDLYFGGFEEIDQFDFAKSVTKLYQAKALCKNKITLHWVKISLNLEVGEQDVEIGFKPDNQVPPFSFCLALRALNSNQAEIIIKEDREKKSLTLLVKFNPSCSELNGLVKKVQEKLSIDVCSLSDGQTSTALAMIIKASQEYEHLKTATEIDLAELRLSYQMEPIK